MIAYFGDFHQKITQLKKIEDLENSQDFSAVVLNENISQRPILNKPIVFWGDLKKVKDFENFDFFFSTQAQEQEILKKLEKYKNPIEKDRQHAEIKNIDFQSRRLEKEIFKIENRNLEIKTETINTKGLSEYVLRLLSVNTIEQLIYETESLRILRQKGIKVTLIFSDNSSSYLSTKSATKKIKIDGLELLEENTVESRQKLASIFSRPVLGQFKVYKNFIENFSNNLFIIFESQKSFLEEAEFLKFLKKILIENFIRVLQSEQNLRNSSLLSKAFSQIPNKALLVSSDYTIRVSNIKESIGKKCFKYLFDRDKPCEGCPVFDYRNAVEKYSFYGKGFLLNEQNYAVYTTSVNSSGKSFYLNIYETLLQAQKRESIQIQRGKLKSIGLVSQALTHELNNPLTGMKELALELSNGFLNQTKEDFLSIHDAANRCLKIIESLNKFSSKRIEFERIKFSDVINEAMILTKVLTRGVSLKVNLDENIWISGSRTLLIQAIFNVIKNSSEAMNHRGKIEVELMSENQRALLKFKDSGPGFPEEMKDISLFGTKNKKKGTGFGLFLVSEFVKLHKGELKFYNAKEGGAVFSIYIPRTT